MQLEPTICYRATASRDARFDGRFFLGVTSTGIYCRPVCPAPTPKRENCRYFRCAAEAEEAGFRPCLRCRPESSPGTPAWSGASATVSRALRLIHEGALDGAGVGALADRLGVGERHLRRLFREHLGASPRAIEQTRRLQLAKQLIDETRLPMRQIAISTGFGSVRRFNAAFRKTYDSSPSVLRRSPAVAGAKGAGFSLRLSFRPPYHWSSILGFLGQRAVAGVEQVAGNAYRRTISLGDRTGTIEVCPLPGRSALLLRLPLALADCLPAVVQRVRGIFDLGADPITIARHLRRDEILRPMLRAHAGVRVPGCWDRFELAVRAILGQQISVRGATTLAARLAESFGRPLDQASHGLTRLFPTPQALASADLAGIGLPAARARALRVFARAVIDGELELDASAGLPAAIERICRVPGLGEWTAQYVAMRALGEPDAFPASDLGLRKALARNGRLPARSEVLARSEAWRPWRAYAAMHLWLSQSRASTRSG